MPVSANTTRSSQAEAGLLTNVISREEMVPQARLERALLSEQDFESSASTNSTTGAQLASDISVEAVVPLTERRPPCKRKNKAYFFSSLANVFAVTLP